MKLSKMPKEELELLSYTKIAKMFLEESKTTMNTADLFKEVCTLLSLSDQEYQNKIADFFQSLSTSKEFILLSDGKWDLKANHSVKITMDDLYEDKESDDSESFEDTEEDINEENDDNYDTMDDYDDDTDDLGDLSIVDEEELEQE
jgi:DNA-directed RNA polymerase subunit delta